MSDPIIGEVRIFANTYAPTDSWFPCDGRALPVSQYQALFSVIGYRYGGSGGQFKVPNLTGLAVRGSDGGDTGNSTGSETVQLTTATVPPHTHQMQRKGPVSNTSKHNTPTAASDVGALAVAATNSPFSMTAPDTAIDTVLDPRTVGMTGGVVNGAVSYTQAHENRQPFLALVYGIAFNGVYMPRP
jgi:microcystin-dependent protein